MATPTSPIMLTDYDLMQFEKYGTLPALTPPTPPTQMKVTIQASRNVRYDQDIELSEGAYNEFKKAVDSGNQQEIQEWLECRINPSDVIEADEFEVLNILFPVKALSLLQPWATLIMLGYKEFETRSWATKHRGPLAIAASAGKAGREACAPGTDIAIMLANHGLTFDDLPRGAILGVCQVDSMHKVDETWDLVLGDVELECGDYSAGRYAWALSHVQPFATPIPCKGALSLWQVPVEVEEQFPLSSGPVAAIKPLPTKAALAAALTARYGGRPIEADEILDMRDFTEAGETDQTIHFQAWRNAMIDWYEVTVNSAGQIDHTTITQLPF